MTIFPSSTEGRAAKIMLYRHIPSTCIIIRIHAMYSYNMMCGSGKCLQSAEKVVEVG